MLGEAIGTRNTWGKLVHVVRPEDLHGADLLRAWLLLVTMGETPEDWGVDTTKAVPVGYDQDRLRTTLPRLVAGLSLVTFGLWLPIWLIIAATSKETRLTLVVDAAGTVRNSWQIQAEAKAQIPRRQWKPRDLLSITRD